MHESCARRSTTIIAPQALALFNSEFVVDCGDALARRIVREETSDDWKARIAHAYRTIFGRASGSRRSDRRPQFLARSSRTSAPRTRTARRRRSRRQPGRNGPPHGICRLVSRPVECERVFIRRMRSDRGQFCRVGPGRLCGRRPTKQDGGMKVAKSDSCLRWWAGLRRAQPSRASSASWSHPTSLAYSGMPTQKRWAWHPKINSHESGYRATF